MKKLMMALLAMMAVLFGTTACGDSIFGQTRIKGSGNLITRTVAVGNFHTIDASRGVKVLLTDEPGDIEICADDNLIEYVRVGIDGGELKITVGADPGARTLQRKYPQIGGFLRCEDRGQDTLYRQNAGDRSVERSQDPCGCTGRNV